ncbi:class I SAM-dependent methyltransferase [Geoglobus acetivorans]|uniref:Class I SAM-dependent methyltransferase n=1 Tax=Geoglobus acetivorans TaxID=565033 RepID=A0ABZ3H5H3_GEOAI
MKKGIDKKKYDRIARVYDLMESPMEIFALSKWRKELMEIVDGKNILEVGIGTGKNIPHYKDWRVVGVDISRKMLEKAAIKSRHIGRELDLVVADVEALPFKDESFDGIISTFVFCSVENPLAGLKELHRVLKKGGKAYFLEHMRCENDFAGRIMDFINPIFRAIGPEINRKTAENIRKTGFKILEEKYLRTSVFRIIVAEK